VVGALTSFAGNAALGLGIIAMWVGFAQVITGSAMKRYGGGFIGALLVGSIIAGVSGQTSTPTTSSTGAGRQSTASNTSAPPPRQQEPPLALVAARGYESDSGGYWYVEGQVRNISNESLSRVTAVSTWFTKDDQFITTDQALIDFDPILAGQTSPFKTITRGNPAMSKYKVEFKELLGGSIAVRDDRKQ